MKANRIRHARRCLKCGTPTYRVSVSCRSCDPELAGRGFPGTRSKLPDPKLWPEDYLTLCAEELLRRHNERHAALVKLGLKAEAA